MDHQAFAQLLGNYGEFVGAIAVVVTLGYLAVQIRQSNVATRAQSVQSTSAAMIQVALAQTSDESWADMFSRAGEDYYALTPGERNRVGWLWFALLRGQETLYHLYIDGSAPQSTWDSHEVAIQHNAKSIGFRQWWRENPYPFTAEFSAVVDKAISQAEKTNDSYQWFGSHDLARKE
jgi:hypothetical protein